MTRAARLAAACAVVVAAAAVRAEPIDWDAVHAHDVIEIRTVDPDGAPRETKVWVAALEGRGYVRTNDSRWYQNLVRDPNASIRFGDVERPVHASVVRDPALRARVDARFAEKYPLSMKVAGWFGRTGGKNCIELRAR